MSIKDTYIIRQIHPKLANSIQIANHYLHKKASCIIAFGLFEREDDNLVGVVLYGNPTAPTTIDICGKENRQNVVELTRLWLSDSCPRNSESFLISNSMKQLSHKIVVSFADPDYDHVGYVYQATNFLYTGRSGRGGKVISIKNSKIHNKTLWKQYGTAAKIREVFGAENVEYIPYTTKHRYVYIRDKRLLSSLKYDIMPYPKKSGNYG